MKAVDGDANLPEIILALSSAGRFASLLNSGNKQRDQHGNHSNDNQQFNDREPASCGSVAIRGAEFMTVHHRVAGWWLRTRICELLRIESTDGSSPRQAADAMRRPYATRQSDFCEEPNVREQPDKLNT